MWRVRKRAALVDPVTALAVFIGGVLILILVFWPQKGFVAMWQRSRLRGSQVLTEDALKHIFKAENEGRQATVTGVAGRLQISPDRTASLLSEIVEHGLVEVQGEKFGLTDAGRTYALHIIRAHRLWERHLADRTGFPETDWHSLAERYEHRLSPDEINALARQLGHPTHDPHGDPIPDADGTLAPLEGVPLTTFAPSEKARGQKVQITHIEDEPEMVYAQLVAEGLEPGMVGYVTEASPTAIIFWANGDEHRLAPVVAANITVLPFDEKVDEQATRGVRLSDLSMGESGTVLSIERGGRRAARRRLMDIGILPGTIIEVAMKNPLGDPVAYRIRNTLIALRTDLARLIHVEVSHGA